METPPNPASRAEAALTRALQHPRLALWVAAIAAALAAPCLFIGFYLDDFVLQYIYTDLPGAHYLFNLYMGGYRIADGIPAVNHWQIEAGYAPWWIYDRLLVALFRPFGTATHILDMRLWPSSAFLMHAHSLAWLALLVLAITRLYRGVHGPLVGGMAALLFAIDHTHGFEVGYICNRHSLITATLGVLCLDQHLRWRGDGGRRAAFLAPLLYLLAMISGESTLTIGAYLFAYEAFADKDTPWKRALSFAPYLLITLVWRAVYDLAGFGARGSGLYIDPGREPARFILALLERGPILLQGLFLAPPAEFYVMFGPALARAMLGLSIAVLVGLCAAFIPLLQRDRKARFWAAGLLFSLVPAASTYPHNRQLLFTSIGAMAIIAQLWHLHAIELRGAARSSALLWSGRLGAIVLFAHLIVSPLALPVASCGIAFAGRLTSAPKSVGDEIGGRDAVFMTAPDYFAVKLVQFSRRTERQPLPRRWRALSFGPQRVTVRRADDRTLELDYEGGILGSPFMELYRDRRIRMAPGEKVFLQGLTIQVLRVTADGRADRARFSFDRSLDDPVFVFYYWSNSRFMLYKPPPIGGSQVLPAATLEWRL